MKILNILTVALCGLTLASCGGSSNEELRISYYPVKTSSDSGWGMMDLDGNIVFDDEFKNEPSAVVNGFFSVKEGDGLAVYKMGKETGILPGCDDLYSAGVMNEGVMPVTKKGERISLIDENGKVKAVLEPYDGKEIIACVPFINEGFMGILTQDGLSGAVNSKGEMVIEPIYGEILIFKEGFACTEKQVDNDESVYVILDKSGKEIANIKEGFIPVSSTFNDGYLSVKTKEGKWGFVNTKGELFKVPGKVNEIGKYNGKYFIFKSDGDWGVMKMGKENQETIVKAKYNNIKFIYGEPDKFLVQKGMDFLVINSKGDELFEFDGIASPLDGNKFKFGEVEGSHIVLLDSKGKPINDDLQLKDLGEEPCKVKIVKSDYFNKEAFVNDLISGITENGIGKYYIDEPAENLGLDAQKNVYSSNFSNDNLNIKGYLYKIQFTGYTNTFIGAEKYSGGQWSYSINPNSKVIELVEEAVINKDCWDQIKPLLFSAIESKGFVKVSEDSERNNAVFKAGDVNLFVKRNGYNIKIAITKNDKPQNIYL